MPQRHRVLLVGALLVTAAALLAAVTAAAVSPAGADSGRFSADDGPSCSYIGSGSSYSVNCSGYSRSARSDVRYSCDYAVYGGGAVSWRCRDGDGNRWSGSR